MKTISRITVLMLLTGLGPVSAQQFYLDMRVALVDDLGNGQEEIIFREPLFEESLYLSAIHTFPDMSTTLNESESEASLITGVLHARSICPGTSCAAKASWKDTLTFDATGLDSADTLVLNISASVDGITGPTVGTGYTLFAQSVANFAVVDTARATGIYFNSEPTTTSNPDAFTAGEQQGTWFVYGPNQFVGQLVLEAGAVNSVHVETIINGDTTMDITTTFDIVADPPIPFTSVSGVFLSGNADADNDDVLDVIDNCLGVFNPEQTDTNADGFGNDCDADLNNDCAINFLDLSIMSDGFFTNPASPNWNPDADLNGDNLVNFADLNRLSDSFFGTPGPSGQPNICD